ncbi:hypothetical protein GUITHDRAFT_144340 [Guillardia theta CCMP2712]|uniref:Uncharacterized protein n=4 Tax=Guillardia theta TaxID=55529 RepID=L1IQ62_GUITC|nr:hypothetical protein GUITHDRAFT_144340 [Guillardia theta CCMP2712]EKX38222.1 hypothetical protein GUITHDRAFT_144340 [Guillardia theta CCMP2712]|eukprot:XP_005825202.1 hypothetical protein GUITHDRAFT_144340 [Guillardia theta CCMP2712]
MRCLPSRVCILLLALAAARGGGRGVEESRDHVVETGTGAGGIVNKRERERALEQCLRELDEDVGHSWQGIAGTMDAAFRSPTPWWRRAEDTDSSVCAQVNLLWWMQNVARGLQGGLAGCKFSYGSSRRRAGEMSQVGLRLRPPLLMIIDPLTIDDALVTLQSLAGVEEVDETVLFIMLDACGPRQEGWTRGEEERCSEGLSEAQIRGLVAINFMEVRVIGFDAQGVMLVPPPLKKTRWSFTTWQQQQDRSASFYKVRALHALRHVLDVEDFYHAILLEPGCVLRNSFYLFHRSSVMFAHRTAVLAVVSSPPDDVEQTFEHPCEEEAFSLSEQLQLRASLGLNRRALLELYENLHAQDQLGLKESLRSLNNISSSITRYFLYPSAGQVVEDPRVGQGDGTEQAARGSDPLKFRRLIFDEEKEEGPLGPLEPQGPLHFSHCSVHGWAPRLKPRRVYDMVTFFQETQMLLLRLHELNSTVDVHVVVEGDRTFRGDAKQRLLPRWLRRFQSFKHKLRLVFAPLPAHLDISLDPCTSEGKCAQDVFDQALANSWTSGYRNWFKREWYSRHALAWGLWDAQPDDLLILGDVDEIPRASLVRAMKECEGVGDAVGMSSQWFQYKWWMVKKDRYFWTPALLLFRSLAVPDIAFSHPRTRPGDVERGRSISLKSLRCFGFWRLIPWMENKGWHFSYFGSTTSLLRKISSFSDEDFGLSGNLTLLEEVVRSGLDFHSVLETLNKKNSDSLRKLDKWTDISRLPKYLQDHLDMFDEDWSNNEEISQPFHCIPFNDKTLQSDFTASSHVLVPSKARQRPVVLLSTIPQDVAVASGRCDDQCVWLTEATGRACEANGLVDVKLFWAGRMPERTEMKPQRQVWGFYDLFSALPEEMQANVPEANKSVDVDAFDLILSKETFPEMFISPFDYCNLQDHCSRGPHHPLLSSSSPHLLIMIPQNGHAYSQLQLPLIYR